MVDIVERLNDHSRGCQGREYTCSCGYDDQRDAEILRLRAEVERLTGDLKRANELVNAALDDYREARAEEREQAAQITDEKASYHLRLWEDDSVLPEAAVEHKACADALKEASASIRQAVSGEGET